MIYDVVKIFYNKLVALVSAFLFTYLLLFFIFHLIRFQSIFRKKMGFLSKKRSVMLLCCIITWKIMLHKFHACKNSFLSVSLIEIFNFFGRKMPLKCSILPYDKNFFDNFFYFWNYFISTDFYFTLASFSYCQIKIFLLLYFIFLAFKKETHLL